MMEIQESSLPGFYCSRILGLAPYLIRRNAKGRIDDIRRSSWLCFYTVCFMTASGNYYNKFPSLRCVTTVIGCIFCCLLFLLLVSLTVRFIFVDASSETPIRMRTATSKFVTVFDVCVVVGACLCGAITGLIGKRHIQKINSNLRKADDELALFNDPMKDKKRNLIMVIIVFLTMTGMISLDVVSKWRNSAKYKRDHNTAGVIRIENYLPFYLEYYILMALHTQVAQTAIGIQRRYHRLNLAIRNIFSLKKLIESATNSKNNKNPPKATPPDTNIESNLPGSNINASAKPVIKVSTLSRASPEENHAMPVFTGKYSASLSTTAFGKLAMSTTTLTRASFFLDRLSYTHAILGETVTLFSKSFGMTMLVMLASCLLHLVATSYFLFIELLGDPDMFVASLQLLWCCFHTCRLLLIVEPCHMATTELQHFWRQLLADRTYFFTACGMCTIDRQILTSISGAIATYLVILIQFQKTDG